MSVIKKCVAEWVSGALCDTQSLKSKFFNDIFPGSVSSVPWGCTYIFTIEVSMSLSSMACNCWISRWQYRCCMWCKCDDWQFSAMLPDSGGASERWAQCCDCESCSWLEFPSHRHDVSVSWGGTWMLISELAGMEGQHGVWSAYTGCSVWLCAADLVIADDLLSPGLEDRMQYILFDPFVMNECIIEKTTHCKDCSVM